MPSGSSKAGFMADIERLVEPVAVPVPELAIADGDEDEADDVPHDVPDGVDASDLEPRGTGAEPVMPESEPSARAGSVAELFSQVRVERTDSGGLRIEAGPEAAGELANLLEGLAGLLRQAGARR